jgi:uncharacterized protein (DUF2147 family)
MKVTFLILLLHLFNPQTDSIEGVWVTQDDETGVKKSEVTIYWENNKLYGKITKLLLPEDQGKKCVECKGDDRGKPIEGMIIVRDLIYADDNFEDGTIMDPKSGKVYDCYIVMEDDNTLRVRGFLGFSILGRTQIWERKK